MIKEVFIIRFIPSKGNPLPPEDFETLESRSRASTVEETSSVNFTWPESYETFGSESKFHTSSAETAQVGSEN